MRAATRRWVAKAEGDLLIVETLLPKRSKAVNDGICFHAQQCAEKYLKAVLQEMDIRFDRTHNLVALLNQILPHAAEWEMLRPELADLSQFAVVFRYPGSDADRPLARRAIETCLKIRQAARLRLGLAKERRVRRPSRKRRATRVTRRAR
jgi:HEPN domain-containing protein